MNTFELALKNTLMWEGGFVDDPKDPGGMTYKGISRRYHPNWEGWKYVDRREFQEADRCVENFYRLNFWLPLRLDEVPERVAPLIFDTAVNIGTNSAARLVQKALNVCGMDLEVDGIIGQKTLRALKETDLEKFAVIFRGYRIAHYVNLTERVSSNSRFLYGWLRRAFSA